MSLSLQVQTSLQEPVFPKHIFSSLSAVMYIYWTHWALLWASVFPSQNEVPKMVMSQALVVPWKLVHSPFGCPNYQVENLCSRSIDKSPNLCYLLCVHDLHRNRLCDCVCVCVLREALATFPWFGLILAWANLGLSGKHVHMYMRSVLATVLNN